MKTRLLRRIFCTGSISDQAGVASTSGDGGSVQEGRLPERIKGPAPVEMQLEWLLGALAKNRERYQALRAEALEQMENVQRSRDPIVARAKAKTAAGIFGQVINGLDWLLAKHRPWSKHQLTNLNEQSKGEPSADD